MLPTLCIKSMQICLIVPPHPIQFLSPCGSQRTTSCWPGLPPLATATATWFRSSTSAWTGWGTPSPRGGSTWPAPSSSLTASTASVALPSAPPGMGTSLCERFKVNKGFIIYFLVKSILGVWWKRLLWNNPSGTKERPSLRRYRHNWTNPGFRKSNFVKQLVRFSLFYLVFFSCCFFLFRQTGNCFLSQTCCVTLRTTPETSTTVQPCTLWPLTSRSTHSFCPSGLTQLSVGIFYKQRQN